ncbi:MAG: cbb3-type cytochrome c oxidase subunit 3 [Polyangia bacterium]
MYHEFFSGRGLLILPIVAMLSFLITFVAAVLYTLRGSQRAAYAELAGLPLSDDGTAVAQAAGRAAAPSEGRESP